MSLGGITQTHREGKHPGPPGPGSLFPPMLGGSALFRNPLRGIAATAAALMLLLAAGGCSAVKHPPQAQERQLPAEARYPFTVTDDLNRKVTVTAKPERIVSLAPSNTEIMFAVGLGSRIVAVDNYSDYPAEAAKLTKIGGFSTPSVEKIAALKPDLVVGTDMHQKLLDQFDRLKIPVVLFSARSVEGVMADIRLLGEVTSAQDQAGQVVEGIARTLTEVQTKLGNLPDEARPLTYYELYSDPLMSVGPKTLIHQIITLAGGKNIVQDADTDYPKISAEVILKRNPQVIIFPLFHGTNALTAEQIRARPGWGGVKAIKEGRVLSVDANLISRPGPRVAQAVEELARIIHPEKFLR